ncbi:hypothetical protein Tco_0370085 [Tanacetum coccineum]
MSCTTRLPSRFNKSSDLSESRARFHDDKEGGYAILVKWLEFGSGKSGSGVLRARERKVGTPCLLEEVDEDLGHHENVSYETYHFFNELHLEANFSIHQEEFSSSISNFRQLLKRNTDGAWRAL